MRRLVFLLTLVFGLPLCAQAQNTVVQATVVDPMGNPYTFGTGAASLVCPGNAAPTHNGTTVQRNYPTVSLDGNGHFQQTVYDVNQLDQTGCAYRWTITWSNGITSFIATNVGLASSGTPITGPGPVNISAPINLFAVPLPQVTSGVNGSGTPTQLAGWQTTNTLNSIAGSSANPVSGQITLTATSDGTTPFTIGPHSITQSADLFHINSPTLVPASGFDTNGNLVFYQGGGTVKLGAAGGTPCTILLPSTTPSPGQFLSASTNAAGACQTSWVTVGGGGTGNVVGPVTPNHLSYAAGANVINDVAGSAVTGGTGAILLTAGADSTTPLSIAAHSATQTAPIADFSSNSSTPGLGQINIRGRGTGAWSAGGGPILLHIMEDAAPGQAPVGWMLSNNRSGYRGNGAPQGATAMYCGDTGICQMTSGGTDANGNYSTFVFESVGRGVLIENSDNNNNTLTAEETVLNGQTVTTHDTVRWDNNSGVMSGIDNVGNIYWNGATSGTAKMGVAAAAGTPCRFVLPTTSASAGNFLQAAAPSGGDCQTSWVSSSATPCITTPFSVQYNNAGVLSCAQGITTADGNNLAIKGPQPWIDLSAYARVAINSSVGPTTTCSITAAATAMTLASGALFKNGDGINCRGAGATLTITTPGAPTVTPSLAAAGTGLQDSSANGTVVNSPTGATTYSYELIAADKFGGYTAPSTATTITNGLAALGSSTCAVSTLSRSGFAITITFTAACNGSVVGTMLHDSGSTSGTFTGWYNVTTVNSTSQVVVTGPIDSNGTIWESGTSFSNDEASNAATGGQVEYWPSNHLSWAAVTGAWKYYICGKRPADVNYKLIGQTMPSTSVETVTNYDDYGSPYNDNQTYPSYITNSLCNGGAAQNDPLNTTIVSGGGTNNIVVANAAVNTVAGTAAVFDDCPGLQTAVNNIYAGGNFQSGTVLIPSTITFNDYWVINSYCKLTGNATIWHEGALVLNEPLELVAGTKWLGYGASNGVAQFGYYSAGGATLTVNSVPGVYISGDSVYMSDVGFGDSNQNGQVLLVDDAPHTTFNHMGFNVSSTTDTDFLGMGLVERGMTPSQDGQLTITNSNVLVGNYSTKDSWTPSLYVTVVNTGYVVIDKMALNMRGFEQHGGGTTWELTNVVRQAGCMPLLWFTNPATWQTGIVWLRTITLDTDISGVMAIGNSAGVAAFADIQLRADNISMGSQDTGGFVPAFTGFEPRWADMKAVISGKLPNSQTIGTCPYGGNGSTVITCTTGPQAMTGSLSSIYFPLPVPTGVTPTLTAGGSLASGTFQFAIIATGVDGKDTIASVISAAVTTSGTCPGSGNCSVSLAYTGVVGAVTYKLAACGPGLPTCPGLAVMTTAPFTANPLVITTLTSSGASPILYTQSGVSGHTASQAWAPTLLAQPQKFATLVACGASTEGAIGTVTDSTASASGGVIAGGGANVVRAFCNGTNWLVSGTNTLTVSLICTGQIALTTGAIASGTRATNTLACSGLSASTDSINCTFSGDTNAVTGYAPSASGGLTLKTWASANTINVDQVNNTSSGITPGAATVNCKGLR